MKDLERQGTPGFPYVFDPHHADRIFMWFEEYCRHVRGPFSGEPIQLLPFQKFDLGCLFGWVHKDTGKRRFRKSFNMRARGNVKSTEMSGLAPYFMVADCLYPPGKFEERRYEESPEVELLAVDKQQAGRIGKDARAMAQGSPKIAKHLRIRRTYIEHVTRGGFLRTLSKDTGNKDSGAPCFVVVDEFHAHKTSENHDTLYSSLGKRFQSLMCVITTAGEDAENSPCKKEYDTCGKILDGVLVDESYLIVIRELDPGDDPHDEKLWVKANPIFQELNEYSLEILEQVRDEHNKAFNSGDPGKTREFLIKRMDLWQADSETKYMSGIMDRWKALAIRRKAFLDLVRGRECFVGFDLSKNIDLTAIGFVFPLDDGRYAVTAHGFIPENAVTQHEHGDRVSYRTWAKEGWCTIVPGYTNDDSFTEGYLHTQELDEEWKVCEACYDPYGARQLANSLISQGYECVEIRQGVQTLSEPTKKFRELVLQGKIVHDGSPLLTWCISNAVEVIDRNGNIKLSKRHKDDSQRIDLLAAILNAHVRAMVTPAKTVSMYDEPVRIWY